MALPSRSAETPLAPKLPLRLGRFTLCEELGAGGMATVYLARMEMAGGLERLVALKTIHPHLAKEGPFVDMFLDEARIASHVSHPNVCSTHDFGEVDGVYYLAMEYLLGEPLFDVINRMVERFDETREVLPFLAARMIADAAEGIHAAHSARGPDGEELHIVHRDVSPQNLFLTYEGSVNVVDFGCAKAAERVAHTSTGVMKGKVGYAAPEQLKSDHVDHRADVWALGVCLWETLTLSPLFSRDTAVKTAMAVLEDEIELASDGRDWIPDEVAYIAERALSRDPDERYETARDLSRDLRKFIADSGYTLESAELAEWMDFLFDDRHDEREAQARRVQEMDLSDVSTAPLYEAARQSDVEWLSSEPAPLEAIPYDDDAEDDDAEDDEGAYDEDEEPEADEGHDAPEHEVFDAMEPVDPLVRRRQSRRGWLALLALLALLLGGYFVFAYEAPESWREAVFGGASSATTETPDEPSAGDEGPEVGADPEASDPAAADPAAAPNEAAPTEAADPEATEPEATEPEVAEVTEPEVAEVTEPEVTPPAGRRGARGRRGGASAEPTAPVAVTNPSVGFVSVRATSGFAVIYENGRRLGQTPLRAELSAGRHTLRVLPYGHEPAEQIRVNVEAGLEETLVINVQDPTEG